MILRKFVLFSVVLFFTACGDVGTTSPSKATITAPNLSNKSSIELAKNEDIGRIQFSNSGDRVTSCQVSPNLPQGLSLKSDCSITGTPTANHSPTTYVVTGKNEAGSDTASINISVITMEERTVKVSGTITYDSVPFKSGLSSGLNYNRISKKKVRGTVVEILNSSNRVLGSTTTNADGLYSLNITGTSVKVRVYAKLYKAASGGQSSWDFQVKDNTNRNALYVMEGSLASLGTKSTQTRNLNASSGWTGSRYGSTRVAAPFAILDVVYQAIHTVTSAQSDAVFPPLNLFWSKNNVAASGSLSLGQIITSHFDGTALYILGKENSDSDEYDSVIIGHEWGHYYESVFSRADSIGGPHGTGDELDIRLAFGEGFGTAMGAIITGNSLYRDSYGSRQGKSFGSDLEAGTVRNPGWYSEASIYNMLYDIYDSQDDEGDTLSLGFSAIHKVLTTEQKNTPAFTSIFSFIKALKNQNPGYDTEIDTLLAHQKISPIRDIYGTGRTNRRVNANPLYSHLNVGQSVNITTDYSADSVSPNNRLGTYNFVTFTVPSTRTYTISIRGRRTSNTFDPDIYLYTGSSNEPIAVAERESRTEQLSKRLEAGTYRMAIIAYGTSTGSTYTVTLN